MPKFELRLVRTVKIWEYATVIVEADDEKAANAMGELIAGEGDLYGAGEHEHGIPFECLENFDEGDATASEVQDTACLAKETRLIEPTTP